MPTLVGDGLGRYFAHDDGATSWTLSPDKVDDWLASLEASANASAARVEVGKAEAASMGASKRNLLMASELKKKASEQNLRVEWTVRIHPDFGQV